MFKAPLIAISAMAVILGSAAASAATKSDEQKTALTVEHKNGETLYCLTEKALTGSRLPVRTCKNRAEWAKDGFKFPEDRSAADKSAEAPKG
ncbi:MAG: hypothetical protein J7485_14285 [Sphingobium sp.]|nr:hypothetical protein [Sphingobium sp.]